MRFAARLIKGRLSGQAARVRSGTAAVEFALVGPLFVFLMAVAFDLGLLLFTQSVLNAATLTASRIIMTNQTGGSSTSFTTALCNNMEGLVPCADLQYYVQSASSFSAMNPIGTSGGNLKNAGTFSPGSAGADVVVQVAYSRPTLIPWALIYVGGHDSVISNSSNLLVSVVSFQNEP
jgi:Flp pilus assembly protein TadG